MGFFSKLFGNNKSGNDLNKLTKTALMLDENLYWEIIADSINQTDNQENQEQFLISRLRTLTPDEIIGFKLRTDKFLFDTYTTEMWCAGYIMNGGCSDDGFEYFRRWVISRGRNVFEKAKNNPDTLVEQIQDNSGSYDFEGFYQAPDDAFKSKTSEEIYDYIDDVAFEKVVGKYPDIEFNWEEENPDSMKKICPNLFEKMWI